MILRLRDKMKAAKKEDGTPVYTLASGLSLMIFYVFAMQCMSTLAVVKRETKTWKWPIIQLIYMTGLGLYNEFNSFPDYLNSAISAGGSHLSFGSKYLQSINEIFLAIVHASLFMCPLSVLIVFCKNAKDIRIMRSVY